MERWNDWYFRDWEKRKSPEDGKTRYVYAGAYYALPLEKRGRVLLKCAYAALLTALITVYFASATSGAAGTRCRFVALPDILGMIPLLFLTVSVGSAIASPARMTYRGYAFGYRRMGKLSVAGMVVMGAASAAEAVFMAMYGPEGEWGMLAGLLACAAIYLAFYLLGRKFPCRPARPDR